ncbi:undecaprenyl-diphosphate phosphatase [Anaerobacillus isosaccharinicus]|uniref:Undecaprenyl-diphosphatase n=1 Tax=Anaerobacillus isosaccharinicus TaxID=1532552 RepID=A0A1S2LUB3_9BACI|nr:undecaprenyl-diphosphate phosphatase [Anaerobacillus isosaccharinicus]MBA5585539.1 undecaprenyl-diphosphate phosphatase [Anaerobacillus isosaccharinicus]QOY36147.1 undecaprenyl-diphosphate phosphatase [Anaerobacillus isosaccharinicus]
MNWLEALILGIVQGLSEFLPISSSAHLIIVGKLLGIKVEGNQLEFEVLLHFASLLAVSIYFRKEISDVINGFFSFLFFKKKESKFQYHFGLLLLFSTGVTAVLGKLFEGVLGANIINTATIGASLIVTGLFLILIEHGVKAGKRTAREMTWKDGLIIGLGQALAVLPGISRAGSTLVTALWCGLEKQTAVRYSFLLSIPLILGISIVEIPNMSPLFYNLYFVETTIAFTASFLFAIIGIKWLIAMVNRTKLSYFAIYCIALGAIVWIFLNDVPFA